MSSIFKCEYGHEWQMAVVDNVAQAPALNRFANYDCRHCRKAFDQNFKRGDAKAAIEAAQMPAFIFSGRENLIIFDHGFLEVADDEAQRPIRK